MSYSKIPVATIPTDITRLIAAVSDLPVPDWTSTALGEDYLGQLRALAAHPEMRSVLTPVRENYKAEGHVVVRLGDFLTIHDDDTARKALTLILADLGQPFGAYQKKGFWQDLGVDPNAKDLRAQSTGYIPLHVDFDQAVLPPDGVALFCVRPDPHEGGESILFNYRHYIDSLMPEELDHLSKTTYAYEALYGTRGIGEIYNPHPFVTLKPNGGTFFRYNGKAQPTAPQEARRLFDKLEDVFRAQSLTTRLERGDLLVIDQNKMLHGRLPLTPGKEASRPRAQDDRMLWQVYLRHNEM